MTDVIKMTEQQPLVSIVIPCYNHAQFVQETIQSVIDQDYENIELIIIDDGSKDNSVEVIQEMVSACEERFVRFEFRFRPNKGLCETLNEAIEWCTGFYLSFFASDDVMLKERIIKQVNTFKNKIEVEPKLVAIYSGVEYFDDKGVSLKTRAGSGKFCRFEEVAFRSEFLPSPTFLVRRESILAVGGFNPDYKVEDFYIRMKLTHAGGVFYVMPDILVKYRRHDDNLSKKSDLMLEEVNKILSQYKNHPNYNEIQAASLMVQAHDYQLVSNIKGVSYLLKALRLDPKQLFSKSIFKFLIKLVYNPSNK